jgi:hypothetical protein
VGFKDRQELNWKLEAWFSSRSTKPPLDDGSPGGAKAQDSKEAEAEAEKQSYEGVKEVLKATETKTDTIILRSVSRPV